MLSMVSSKNRCTGSVWAHFQNGGSEGIFELSNALTITNPMEILPILETNTSPKPNVWYVLSPEGDGPCIRVGHTCTFVPGETRRVLVIGGANPDGSFADVYVLNLGLLFQVYVVSSL